MRSRPLPAAARIAPRLASACSVCSATLALTGCDSPARTPTWPETNTNCPAAIACEYGAPWNGAGASSVRTACLSVIALTSLVGWGAEPTAAGRSLASLHAGPRRVLQGDVARGAERAGEPERGAGVAERSGTGPVAAGASARRRAGDRSRRRGEAGRARAHGRPRAPRRRRPANGARGCPPLPGGRAGPVAPGRHAARPGGLRMADVVWPRARVRRPD